MAAFGFLHLTKGLRGRARADRQSASQWLALVAQGGTPFNGGTGTAATGREAREACEGLVPIGTRERAPRAMLKEDP